MSFNLATFLAFAVGAILGIGLARIVKNRGVARIRVRRDISVSPEDAIAIIRQVEREPEMIPFVRTVEVLRRHEESVRYKVIFKPFPRMWAIYTKTFNTKKRRVDWRSEAGAYGLKHSGQIRFQRTATGHRAELTSEYSFAHPVVGPALTMITEWFVAGAMSAWLRNVDRKASR